MDNLQTALRAAVRTDTVRSDSTDIVEVVSPVVALVLCVSSPCQWIQLD